MEMLKVTADNWPTDVLRKCSGKIRELIDIGIMDAGPGAREATKEALTTLNKKMPDVDHILNHILIMPFSFSNHPNPPDQRVEQEVSYIIDTSFRRQSLRFLR